MATARPAAKVQCGGAWHGVEVEGTRLVLLDHDDGDADAIVVAFGAPAQGCFLVREAWRYGDIRLLPRPLRPGARKRWRSAGVRRGDVLAFVAAAERPVRIGSDYIGAFPPHIEASLWHAALGRRFTPEELASFRALGLDNGKHATAVAEAIGSPITLEAIRRLQHDGIVDAMDLQYWLSACGHVPSNAERAALARVGVEDGFDALCWSDVLGGTVTVDGVNRLRREGVTDPQALIATRSEAGPARGPQGFPLTGNR